MNPKFLNLNTFANMDKAQLREFAASRNLQVDLSNEDLPSLRVEIATKDAMRFKNKGLRVVAQAEESAPTVQEMQRSLLSLKTIVIALDQRVRDLEKRLEEF